MRKTLDTFIEKVFRENTLVGTALLALAVWFGGVIAPDKFNWISSNLTPLVMVLILLELYISRTKTTLILDDLKEIRKTPRENFRINHFIPVKHLIAILQTGFKLREK